MSPASPGLAIWGFRPTRRGVQPLQQRVDPSSSFVSVTLAWVKATRLREDFHMPPGRLNIAIIDNRDSFVFNLSRYLEELGAAPTHFENTVQPTALADFDAVLISPGPGTPEQAGRSIEIVKWASEIKKPLLGVCLGHQVIARTFGFEVTGAAKLIHGYTSKIEHQGQGIFTGIPSSFKGTRYHSLAVQDLAPPLFVTARSDDGTIMGLQHESLPIHGVQFHPEAILTEFGHDLLKNWLNLI